MTPPPSPETLDRVIGILALFASPRVIEPRSSLARDLALDSLDRVLIQHEIAAAFEFEMPDAEIHDWDTVEDIARTVQQRGRA